MKQHKWHKENREHFNAWYDRFFLQSPNSALLEDDADKMYEAWKGGQQTVQNDKNWVMICKKCGDELGIVYEPKDEIGDAEIKQMLNDIKYYQKRVEELEEQCEQLKATITKFREIEDEYAHRKPMKEPYHVGWAWINKDDSIREFNPLKSGEETLGMDYVKLYTHPTQPLSDSEKLKIIRIWSESSTMREQELIGLCDAIEKAHGIGEDK